MSTPFVNSNKSPEVSKDLMLPHSLEAEQAVLGAILADSECFSKVIEVISEAELFYKKSHQIIFDAFLALVEANNNIDVITTTQHLKDKGTLDEVGGRSYLSALTDHAPIAANAEYYAKTVQEKSLLRSLIVAGNEIVELGYHSEEDLDALVDKAERLIFSLAQSKAKEDLTPVSDIVQKTWEVLEEREANKGALIGVDTGFYDLNAITSGLQKSDLLILAARPSMGKCLHKDSEIVLEDGSLSTIEEIYKQGKANLLTLNSNWKFSFTKPSDFVDDGIKPIFEVTTRLGRKVTTTITHPFLTINGWRKLGEIAAGDKIAVPRIVNVFGKQKIRDCEAKLLGYLIGDGSLTGNTVGFTNDNHAIQKDFKEAVQDFDLSLEINQVSHGKSKRAASFRVSKNQEFLIEERQLFAQRLKASAQRQGLSARSLAKQVGVNPATVHYWYEGSCAPSLDALNGICAALDLGYKDLVPNGLARISKSSKSSLYNWLEDLRLSGKDSHSKFVPELIFTANKENIALFLNRLFATDGWATVLSSGQSQLGYASASERLVRQVQHLLLRFGIIAAIREKKVKYKDSYRKSWQLNITDKYSIETFIDEIGIFGKEEATAKVQEAIAKRKYQTNKDLVPVDIWSQIQDSKGEESWSALAKRAGIESHSNIHAFKGSPTRHRLSQLAEALQDQSLKDIAEGEVYWDEIVSIEHIGEDQVYDLTVPETHNFVANDICVHNTALCLNIAENVAIINKKPVAVFSLEMSKEQLVQRILCSRAQVDSNRIRTGQMYPEDWTRLGSAMSDIGQAQIFIDDSAGISVMELRGKCRRLKAEHGDLGLVIIDYLQLMQGKASDNRINQISEISRGLKMLARELDVPVMALSQLSRAVEARQDKRPMLSDLRESGSIEQDADIVMFVYRDDYYNPDSEKAGVAEIIVAKQRSGPVGTIELLFQSNITRFRNPIQENQ